MSKKIALLFVVLCCSDIHGSDAPKRLYKDFNIIVQKVHELNPSLEHDMYRFGVAGLIGMSMVPITSYLTGNGPISPETEFITKCVIFCALPVCVFLKAYVKPKSTLRTEHVMYLDQELHIYDKDDSRRAISRGAHRIKPQLFLHQTPCTICLDTIDVNYTSHGDNGDVDCTQLTCGHMFHTSCLTPWMHQSLMQCPNCRRFSKYMFTLSQIGGNHVSR